MLAPALFLMVTLWGIATFLGARRGTVPAPASLAGTLCGIALALSMSDLGVLSGLRQLLTESGDPSVAAVAAWIYEALRPVPFVFGIAALLQLVTIILLYRHQRGEGRVVTMIVLIALLLVPVALHQAASTSIVHAFQRREMPDLASLHWSIGAGACAFLASLVIAIASMAGAPRRPASRMTFLLAASALILTIVGAGWTWETAEVFHRLAMG